MTGLRNRAFATTFLSNPTLSTSDRALLIVDLDHFKSVNDIHGHAAGDLVLATFAKRAMESIRGEDVIARWGGEEFLVILGTPDEATATAVAERLREALAATPITLPGGISLDITCSIGACLLPASLTWQEALELADLSLYNAKRSGRNRLVWARTLCELRATR